MVLASGGGGGILLIVAYIAFFVLIMYFVAIRPQKKQQKQQQEMLSSMEKGDSVLTSSGFYGVVIDITDDSVIVEFGSNKNCRIPMQKSAIVQIEKAEA
jgi:preprotein translocase subunit YajC